jgi:glycosyltransferase involved in cell wall biosynthesis
MVRKYHLENYVKFLGHVSDRERAQLFEEAHLHVQFSKKEGWGLTVLEAASKMTPTICYPVQGLRDSVKESTGYLVKGSLRKEWKIALNDIMTNNSNYKTKQKNCLIWSSQFRWGNQMDRFYQIVLKALVKY